MSLDLTTASGMLKEVYLPTIREQLNNKVMLLNQLRRTSDDVEGNEVVLSLHVRRTSGIGARAEGGTLPTPGNQKYTKERVPLKTNTGRIRLSVQVIKALKTNAASFERAVVSETKRLVNDSKRDVNRQLFGTSDGTIATTAASGPSTTVTLASTTTAVQMRQFENGMVVDISAAATPGNASVASARTISAVDAAAKTFVVSGAAVTTAAGDRVERSGAGGSGSSQKEITGLQTIIDSTGTLFSVDPTVEAVWASTENSTGGTPTENLFERGMDDTEIAGGYEIDLIVTSHGVMRGYSAQLTSQKRFNDTIDLKGGFKGLNVTSGGKTASLTRDRDCPLSTAFGMSTEHIKCDEWTDWDWMDEDGAILSRTQDKLEYEATLYWMSELTTDKRNAHCKWTGLTES